MATSRALRTDNYLELERPAENCPETCTAVSSADVRGLYEVRGEAAKELGRLPAQHYIVGSSCATDFSAPANIVPWVDAQDPVNKSFIAIYVDPKMDHKIHKNAAGTVFLCATQSQSCVCKLTGHKPLAVFGRFVSMLRSKSAENLMDLHLSMERMCPAALPNLLAAMIFVLSLVLAAVVSEAACRMWQASSTGPRHSEKAKVWEDNTVLVKTPIGSFVTGCGWFAGFMMSLAALQSGALLFVEKNTELETPVWFLAAFPAFLALTAAVRLMNLLSKRLLASALLEHGCVLTDVGQSQTMDALLIAMLTMYSLVILCLVSSSLRAFAVTLTALAGPSWALLKAINVARETEIMLNYVETNLKHFAKDSLPKIQIIPCHSLARAGRRGQDLCDLASEPAVEGDKSLDMTLSDLSWQRWSIYHLTGSRAGFLVLPGFAALVATSLFISSMHLANYACAGGELSDLQLPSSFRALRFTEFQDKYEVVIDRSFRQAAIAASSPASATRHINFTQPVASADISPSFKIHQVNDSTSTALEEAQLSNHLVPRVARIGVKGLRPSLPAVDYQVQFSPLMTLPVLVSIAAGDFATHVAWSTLPGSVLSLPQGTSDLDVQVSLADFVLGLPVQLHDNVSDAVLWTAFDPRSDADEGTCSRQCKERLDCFANYLGHNGCFFALGNHKVLESGRATGWHSLRTSNRKLSGHISGCVVNDTDSRILSTCGKPVSPENTVLHFGKIRPDWRSKSATLSLALQLEVGGQRFDSEVEQVVLHQGSPAAIDAIGVVLGELSGSNQTVEVRSSTFVDGLGQITIKLFPYDPLNYTSMRVLLMPLLPDRAFKVQWSFVPEVMEGDLAFVRASPRCQESALVRARYEVCGAKGGIPDRPVALPFAPWTGHLGKFVIYTVTPRDTKWMWPQSKRYTPTFTFAGVDRLMAWAAEAHDCHVLDRIQAMLEIVSQPVPQSTSEANWFGVKIDDSAIVELVSSADALCHLIKKDCTDVFCEGIRMSLHVTELDPPLLSPEGFVKVIMCLHNFNRTGCNEDFRWTYHDNTLQLEDHPTQIPLHTFLAVMSQPDEFDFLGTVYSSLNSTESSQFALDSAREVWSLQTPSAGLVARLAKLNNDMPTWLLEKLISSDVGALALNAAELPTYKATFAGVTRLKAALHKASELSNIAVAVQLAEGTAHLTVSCSCWAAGKEIIGT